MKKCTNREPTASSSELRLILPRAVLMLAGAAIGQAMASRNDTGAATAVVTKQ